MNEMKYFAIKGNAIDSSGAIHLCGEKLYNEGCVTEHFANSCIIREKEYPTGLPSEIPVAIPHCETGSVLNSSICFLRLEKPVIFYRMDESDIKIETKILFNIAVTEPSEHIEILKNLMKTINDENIMTILCNSNIEELPKLLKKYLG
jgi:PTS system galactitol-specific IIA component